MSDFQSLAYDVCRCYVRDQQGLIDEQYINRVLGWIRARDIASLSQCSDLIPDALSCPDLCRFTRQVAAFFKKNEAFSDPEVCGKAAQQSFERAEKLCRITNRRLDHFYFYPERLLQRDPRLVADVERTSRIIERVLGDFGTFFGSIPKRVRVTSGATSTSSRLKSVPYLKVRFRNLPATRKAQPYLSALGANFGFNTMTFRDVQSNRVETVPKNWKTDRTIACEPEGNLTLQLALDDYLKERLRKIGVDLSDQSRNQHLSKKASINGDYATIDLSMASDTLSLNTVAYLLPTDWYRFAADIRTPFGEGFGNSYKYAKFSSMGNGATFTLESLIFAACCKATTTKDVAVYGDDLIVPVQCLDRLYALLRFFGFKINQDKSFTTGPFRESCGTDWYDGLNVTPFYMRSKLSWKLEITHCVNGLAAISAPDGELEELLLGLVSQNNLPLVPFNWSTIGGVWIDSHSAYEKKLIRDPKVKGRNRQIPMFKAFVPKTRTRSVTDSRTNFLWHLDASRRKEGLMQQVDTNPYFASYQISYEGFAQSDCIIRSKVPIFTHKYVRKWVCWVPPTQATPVHLYRWSDLILRSDTEVRQ